MNAKHIAVTLALTSGALISAAGAQPAGTDKSGKVGTAAPAVAVQEAKVSALMGVPVGNAPGSSTAEPRLRLANGAVVRLLSRAEQQAGQEVVRQLLNTSSAARFRPNLGQMVRIDRPLVVDHTAQQTGFRDQGGRGSCTHFGSLANLEAAYKHGGFGDLDLSEQHLNWLWTETMLADSDRPDSLAETQADKRESQLASLSGGNGVANVELMAHYGVAREVDDPYIGDPTYEQYDVWSSYASFGLTGFHWYDPTFPQEPINAWNFAPAQYPAAARDNAKYGVARYGLLSAEEMHDPANVEAVLAQGYDITIDLDLFHDIDHPDPARPVWVRRDGAAEDGGHCMLIVGYDHTRHFFIVKNSWGAAPSYTGMLPHLDPAWRDITRYDGFTLLDYSYLREVEDGAYITQVVDPRSGRFNTQRALGQWDVRFYDRSSRRQVATATLTWRHLPGTAVGHLAEDRRIGDLRDDHGQCYRVNGVLGPSGEITLYVDFARPGTGYTETRGVRLVGTLRAFGIGTPTIDGPTLVPSPETRTLFGHPLGDLTFYATHR